MYKIFRINADSVIDFAAIELKKYLRMMMPRCGEIKVEFCPDAKDGFRLGLMSDFGIDPEVDDEKLDDVIYIDTDVNGGIIAGSNERSVLLAVYRYLKSNGCNWLFPGPDGEYIPITDIKPVKLLHKASCRYRGQCNEGSETQPLMFDAIDFAPKIGMNIFMMEFDVPKAYYQRGYDHQCDPYLEAETPLSNETILQWKRACETELSKRGLQFHDMGHGWTAEPFGFDSSDGWVAKEVEIDPKDARHLALMNGVRKFHGGVALNTNLCMSNPETRSIVANYVADYAMNQNNVDFLHVWLADATNNHCECEECQKKVTSDWYVMMLNDIDAELTKRNLDTHIVFIAYVDTLWGPKEEKIKNEKRFTMLFAPITRSYSETYNEKPDSTKVMPYIRNKLKMPKGMAENLAYLNQWQEMWKGDTFCYEYHFHMHQYYDLGGIYIAKLVYDDIHGLSQNGLRGIVEDCSQRSFFPTGLAFYVYGEAMYDLSKPFDKLVEEYFFAAFGQDWKLAYDYLYDISYTSDFDFVACPSSVRGETYSRYNPDKAADFDKLYPIVDAFEGVIDEHLDTKVRCQYVHWDVLKWHKKYVKLYAKGLSQIALDDTEGASKTYVKLCNETALLGHLRPTMFDHRHMTIAARRAISPQKRYSEVMIEE